MKEQQEDLSRPYYTTMTSPPNDMLRSIQPFTVAKVRLVNGAHNLSGSRLRGDALRYATKHRSSWYVPQRGLYDLQIVSDHWYWPPTSFTRKGILASLAASCHVTPRISTPKMVSRLSYDYLPNASGFNSGQTLNGHNHIAVICNKVTLWIFKIKPYLTTTLICL